MALSFRVAGTIPAGVLVLAVMSGCTAARRPGVHIGPDPAGERLPFFDAVRRLEVWDRVHVELQDETVKGSLAWASKDELALHVSGVERRLSCPEIRSFQKIDSRGAGRGLAIGLLLALVPAYNSCGSIWCWLGGLGIYGGIGAAAGAGLAGDPPIFQASPGWCGPAVRTAISDRRSRRAPASTPDP
jgi:hypothetical protein